jgi:hypothetical protein
MTMRSLAQAQKAEGNEAAARATMTQMVDFFRHQSLKPHVLQKIEMQAARVIE